jgi:hypothetical protein
VLKSKHLLLFLFTISSFFLSSCGFKVSSNGSHDSSIFSGVISGVISPFLGSITENNNSSFFISSLTAATCADPVYAKLYKIENDGSITDADPLASQLIGPDARYSFDLAKLNLSNKNLNVDYIVKAAGCNGDVYKRPVTDFNSNQDINAKTSVVADVVNANNLVTNKLNNVSKNDIQLLINSMESTTSATAIDSLVSSASNSAKFTQIFGTSPTVIQDASPEVTLTAPKVAINELANSVFSVSAFHIDPTYSFAYSWKLDGVVKSSSAAFNYIPAANDSGSHNVDLYVGKNDGAGNIDLSKPYYTKSIAVSVNNNILPTAPAISIDASTPSPRNTNNILIDINTGISLANCANFSHLAVTESATPPGIMQFNIDCTTSGTQTQSITYSTGDGTKNLYVWAIDHEGAISSPSTVSLVVDTLPPVVTLTMPSTQLKGGSTQSITLSASDAGTGVSTFDLYFSSNGGTSYALLSHLANNANLYSWSVPSLDINNGKLKLTATDGTSSTTTVYSPTFTIDSTLPVSPSFTVSSANPSSSSIVSITLSSCGADVAQTLLIETNTAPTGIESGWQNCTSGVGGQSISIAGDGVHHLYVWSKDAAGNIALTSTTQNVTLDTTAPVVSSGPSIASNMNKGGASTAVTWVVTDSTTATIALSYSTDNGSTYAAIASGLTNNGSYSWSIPSVNSSQVKLKLVATDQVGLSSTAFSSTAFIIDSTAPTVAVTTPSGPLKGGDAITLNYSASDTNTISSLQLSYAADGVTFGATTSLTVGSTSTSWTVNSSDVATAKLKITATDAAGNIGTAITSAFTIDSTAPTAPTLARTSGAVSNSTAVTMTVGSCTDTTSILITETNTKPNVGDAGWQICSTGAGVTTATISGEGSHTLYAWAKDFVGNVATSANSVSVILDITSPVIAVTTPSSMQGNVSTGSVSWTLTEANVAASTTFNIEIYNGTSWASVGTKAATAGANVSQGYTLSNFAVPNVDITTAQMRVTIIDAAGNSATTPSGNFIIDSSAPVISSVIINDGATYAGTSLVNVKVNVSDNVSTGAQISVRLGLANASTSDCQSEYANNNWSPWTNANTNFSFSITPIDGVKKICAWAKDTLGNISVFSSPSTGVDGVNESSIIYQTGNPPTIASFSVVRTSDSGHVATAGDPLTISWSAADAEGLDNNPVNISYSTDNITWKDITTNADIAVTANRTWRGSLSGNPTSASDVVTTFNAPSTGYFILKIQSKDQAGNTSIFVLSPTFNTGNWSIYAGTKDRGDGGTGKSAALTGAGLFSLFAINPLNGDIYSVDHTYGIRKLDAQTGLVSTYIKNGTLNLSSNGAMPANPAMIIGVNINLIFDSKGRLYVGVPQGGYGSIIYQIDVANSYSRLYAGGGVADDGGNSATSLQIAEGGYSFDEQNSLYVWTYCGSGAVVGGANYTTVGRRIVKIAQNTNGTSGTTTRIIGDCTFANPVSGSTAYSQPGTTTPYPMYSDIAAWNNGATIVISLYNSISYKIINGTVYSSNIGTSVDSGIYNPADGLLYRVSGSTLDKVSVNTAGANGDTVTNVFSFVSTSNGCTADGTTTAAFCGLIKSQLQIRSGIVYFADGAGANSASNYAVRYFDSNNQLRTVLGGQPFYGDGLNKNLARGAFSGIYYKKSTEPNQTAFPEGLYFMEMNGVVFGSIDPTSNIVTQLWGNQSRGVVIPVTGTTISKSVSMGSAYVGGNGMPLMFDSSGLPWMRANSDAISIDANNKIVRHTNQSINGSIQTAANNVNPVNYGLSTFVGLTNFALKGNGLFVLPNYVGTGADPIISLRYMDFTNLITPIIIGGNYLSSTNTAASGDIATAGAVAAAPLSTNCRGGAANCYLNYQSSTDRLYFAEDTKMRYITTPDNTTTATLGTLFTSGSGNIYNFGFTPDNSQLWYFKSTGGLYCKDISSGKSWCDNSTDYFSIRTTAGFTVTAGANQMTFKDNQTMFVSTYSGQILQFNLPTGP